MWSKSCSLQGLMCITLGQRGAPLSAWVIVVNPFLWSYMSKSRQSPLKKKLGKVVVGAPACPVLKALTGYRRLG